MKVLQANPAKPIEEATTATTTQALPEGAVKTDTVQSQAVETSRTDAPVALAGKVDLSKYDNLPTTAAKIRAMSADGWTMGAISRSGLKTKNGDPIRYQHVRNTLKQQPAPKSSMPAPNAQAGGSTGESESEGEGEGPNVKVA